MEVCTISLAFALVIAQLHPLSIASENALGFDRQQYLLDKYTDTTRATVKCGTNKTLIHSYA